MQKKLEFLNGLDLKKCIHAANYLAKYKQYSSLKPEQKSALDTLFPVYKNYLQKNLKMTGFDKSTVKERVKLLNGYFDFISNNNFNNTFTSQGKFEPTIMEEFMYLLLKDLINDVKKDISDEHDSLKMGGVKAYTNLYFSSKNLQEFVVKPQIGVNQKDQDFAIYRTIQLNVEESINIQANLPVVAIENKTYVDKTMLEGSIATAEKIKSGNPYSLFIIVTETYEVDLAVDPAYSRIDQIYVLRKSKRKEGKQPIYDDVVWDLLENVKYHLKRDWSDIEKKMRNSGKII